MEMEAIAPASDTDTAKPEFGCKHYRRRCKIRAPCCNEVFGCRHCHNEATVSMEKPKDRHEIPRREIARVICLLCDTEQPVAQVCTNCGVTMGEYFCGECKFFDDDTGKGQYHCDECGICRVGGRDKFFHCQKCGSCYSVELRDQHSCVENSMRHNCPICYEYLFDSLKDTSVLKCGHTIHKECFREMLKHAQRYTCPICSKSVIDMSRTWQRLDEECHKACTHLHSQLLEVSYALESHKRCWLPEMRRRCPNSNDLLWLGGLRDWSGSKIKGPVLVGRSTRQIEATAMPEDYRYKVWILCNDCNATSEAFFHVIGHKCGHCRSYNTRTIASPLLPAS